MEDKAFKKSQEMPPGERSEDVPLVQQHQGEDPADGQPSGSSTMTNTSISSGEENKVTHSRWDNEKKN